MVKVSVFFHDNDPRNDRVDAVGAVEAPKEVI
jgi:hypothetical protein